MKRKIKLTNKIESPIYICYNKQICETEVKQTEISKIELCFSKSLFRTLFHINREQEFAETEIKQRRKMDKN